MSCGLTVKPCLLEIIQQTISRHSLATSGDLILVAFSGGPDSTSLLHALHTLGYSVAAAHLNHGCRGDESREDARWAKDFCDDLCIPSPAPHRASPALKRLHSVSLQQAARTARYEFLNEIADQIGATLIATAHTQDDRVETVLLNILRGTGTSGLRGIPYRRGRIIRPLLDVERAEVEAYCLEHGISPRRDSSNQSSAYSRNNVRNELIPYLERRYTASVKSSILRLSDIAAAEHDFLSTLAREWIDGRDEIDTGSLATLHLALQREVLRQWIAARRDGLSDVGHEAVNSIRQSASRSFDITLPGAGYRVVGNGVTLRLVKRNERKPAAELCLPLAVPGTTQFLKWTIDAKGELGAQIDRGSLSVRTWRNGDRIALPAGSRKLQDVFTDAKVARDQRHEWPVIADCLGVLAVPGLAVCSRAASLQILATRAE